MLFPARVNIVFGNRWALANRSRADAVVEIVPVSELQHEKNYRKNGDYRWQIDDDAAARGYLLRSDHHPKRALRGGIPLTLETKSNYSLNQRWEFLFPTSSKVSPDAPFHVRSAISGMFLTVDEATRTATLQRASPEQCWRLHDATGKAMRALFKLSSRVLGEDSPTGLPPKLCELPPLPTELPQLEPNQIANLCTVHPMEGFARGTELWRTAATKMNMALVGGVVDARSHSKLPGMCSQCTGSDTCHNCCLCGLRLHCFDGELSAAFASHGQTQTGRARATEDGADVDFTPVDLLLGNHVLLCDSADVTPPGCCLLVEEILPALFGPDSCFMAKYQEARRGQDVVWVPAQSRAETPWLATAKLSCRVPVPVLGQRPYEEWQRFALCCGRSARADGATGRAAVQVQVPLRSEVAATTRTLAVHQVGRIQAGRFGEFRSESLYLFSQPRTEAGGAVPPIRLQALALAPSGPFAGRALEGYHKALSDFRAVAAPVLAQWAGATGARVVGTTSVAPPVSAVAANGAPALAEKVAAASTAEVLEQQRPVDRRGTPASKVAAPPAATGWLLRNCHSYAGTTSTCCGAGLAKWKRRCWSRSLFSMAARSSNDAG